MKPAILFEDDTFFPRTNLTTFMQWFGLVVGVSGMALGSWEFYLIGGLCCLLIDMLRLVERLVIHKTISFRLASYVIALLVSIHVDRLGSLLILASLLNAFTLRVGIPLLFALPDRWPRSK